MEKDRIIGRVSIITASYKSKKYISETIQSVINQTYSDWEMIIVDDCSPDDSFDYVKNISALDFRIKVLKTEKNGGPAVVRNVGLKASSGQYICFLDADDIYKPNFLESQIKYAKENGSFVYASYERIGLSKKTQFIVNSYTTYKKIMSYNPISCLTAFYDASLLGVFYFDEDQKLRYREDYYYWMSILKVAGKAYGNKEIIASYRISPEGNSRNKAKLIKKEWYLFRQKLNNNVFKALYFVFRWAINGLWRYRNVK